MKENKIVNRIKKFIFDTNNCIITNLPINKDGYVCLQARINGKKKHYLGHRIVYEIYNNVKLNKNQIVCHKCDVRNCINPKHLFVGTHADNVKDKVNKNRQAKGEKNGRYVHGYYSKYAPHLKPKKKRPLNDNAVLNIKKEINRKEKTLKEISIKFNVNYNTIRDISANRIYKDIKVL